MNPQETLQRIINRKEKQEFPDSSTIEAAANILKEYGIENFFLGAKQVSGTLTKKFSCVCVVKSKKPVAQLESKNIKVLPKNITIRQEDGKLIRLPVDVVQCNSKFKYQSAIINPGDMISPNKKNGATIGLVLKHKKLGTILTTAGHFAKDVINAGYKLDNLHLWDMYTRQFFPCSIPEHHKNLDLDYALIQPKNSIQLQFSTAKFDNPCFNPTKSDLTKKLYIISAKGAVPTRFVGASYSPVTLGGTQFKNIFLTTIATQKGDSGAALVDELYRIWGIVIGAVQPWTIIMPISLLAQNEGSNIYWGANNI